MPPPKQTVCQIVDTAAERPALMMGGVEDQARRTEPALEGVWTRAGLAASRQRPTLAYARCTALAGARHWAHPGAGRCRVRPSPYSHVDAGIERGALGACHARIPVERSSGAR